VEVQQNIVAQKSNIVILFSLNFGHIKIFTINLVFQVTLKYGNILYDNVTQQCYNYICVCVLIPLFKPGIIFFPLVYVQIA
jgi:hypothetical protein